MKIKFIVLIGFLIVLGFFNCESNKTSQDLQIKICFAFQDLETEFWVAAHKAITQTLSVKNIQVIERNASQDANKQLEQIRDAIAQEVDGIIFIPQDGQSAVTIIGEVNQAGIPIAVFNRPPDNQSNPAIVVDFMVEEALKRNFKSTPLILVGDLGDQNSIERLKGFYNAINKHPQKFNEVIEVPTKWDANTTLANLEAALQANPEVDFLFTSSDFLYPQVRAVLEPLGKWKKRGEPGHVILGGIDGDKTACQLMIDGYVDATGVQDLFFEANAVMDTLLKAIKIGQKTPQNWIKDPGFALTQKNMEQKAKNMWGCILLNE
jgi:ABC-type sugar transport system substrate-binding protein